MLSLLHLSNIKLQCLLIWLACTSAIKQCITFPPLESTLERHLYSCLWSHSVCAASCLYWMNNYRKYGITSRLNYIEVQLWEGEGFTVFIEHVTWNNTDIPVYFLWFWCQWPNGVSATSGKSITDTHMIQDNTILLKFTHYANKWNHKQYVSIHNCGMQRDWAAVSGSIALWAQLILIVTDSNALCFGSRGWDWVGERRQERLTENPGRNLSHWECRTPVRLYRILCL